MNQKRSDLNIGLEIKQCSSFEC